MSATRPAAAVVLAAGEGTRMRSATPKVLHEVGGRSLLAHAVTAVSTLDPQHLVVVVGHGRDQVTAHLAGVAPQVKTAVQEQQHGTGHAVECALADLPELNGTVVVTYGDIPLLTGDTLRRLLDAHSEYANAVTVLTATVADPTGYGRILRAADSSVAGIVEQKDATDAQQAITEVNSGIYAFDSGVLRAALSRLDTDNAQGELYLTDVLGLARNDGQRVGALAVDDAWQTEGVNDRVQLAAVHRELNRRTLERHMLAGVTVLDPATTWVESDVTLEADTVLHPNTQLYGSTHVARGAEVGPDCALRDTLVGDGSRVISTHAVGAEVGPESTVGPFTHLRPGTRLGRKTKAGAYVEIKQATVGDGSKVPHLAYVGDATIGQRANIGAATVFVNYDGREKHHSTVGDDARVGSDTMLVSPVNVGDGAYTAAGSVITEDVPPGAMGVARSRQRTIEGWVERRRPGSAAAQAAARAKERKGESGSESGSESGDETEGVTGQ